MGLDSFQLKATTGLNCGRYFFNAHGVSGVVPGREDTSTKEIDPSSRGIARNNKNRSNNTEKRSAVMVGGRWFRTLPSVYVSQLFGCTVCGSSSLGSRVLVFFSIKWGCE